MQNLTLIIPTYNRPGYLGQLLAYYRDKALASKVLILDSSQPAIVAHNARVAAECGERFRHVVFPSTTQVALKLLKGIELVQTPFCAFCADDDLVYVNGLSQALAYLQEHPDYVCTDGIYLNYAKSRNDIQLQIEYASAGIDCEHPGARVFRLYQKYESLFYGVFRTPDLADIFSTVSTIPTLHFQELFQATSALLIGKSHRLPIFFAARQHCDAAEINRDKWQTYYWFADDRKDFLQHYLAYREQLWSFYQRRGAEPRLSKDAFIKSMDLAHAVFFGMGCPPEYFYSVLQPQWPNDLFRKADPDRDNICSQLKSPRRRFWENWVDKVARKIRESVSEVYSARDLKSLNTEVQGDPGTSSPWNCALEPELRWFASVKQFRDAYHELCRYLDAPSWQVYTVQVNSAPLFDSQAGWSSGYTLAIGHGPGVVVGPGGGSPNVFAQQFNAKPDERFKVIARASSVDKPKVRGRIQINWTGGEHYISTSLSAFEVTQQEKVFEYEVIAPPGVVTGTLYVAADGPEDVVRYTEMRLLGI